MYNSLPLLQTLQSVHPSYTFYASLVSSYSTNDFNQGGDEHHAQLQYLIPRAANDFTTDTSHRTIGTYDGDGALCQQARHMPTVDTYNSRTPWRLQQKYERLLVNQPASNAAQLARPQDSPLIEMVTQKSVKPSAKRAQNFHLADKSDQTLKQKYTSLPHQSILQSADAHQTTLDANQLMVRSSQPKLGLQTEAREPACSVLFSLVCILYAAALCNFDHGAIPPSLGGIINDFKISFFQQSLLGGLVYSGLIVGILFSGVLLQHFDAKYLLVGSLSCLMGSLIGFVCSSTLSFLYLSRFLNGVAQALPSVLVPVWIDQFAPPHSKIRWMSCVHLSTISGTTLGYMTAGFISHRTQNKLIMAGTRLTDSWRLAFVIQAVAVLPAIVGLTLAKSETFLLRTAAPSGAIYQSYKSLRTSLPGTNNEDSLDYRFQAPTTLAPDSVRDICRDFVVQLAEIFSYPGYALVTLGISNLFFIVTGVQFWILQYLTEGLKADRVRVIASTIFCFVTSPTLGVYTGATIMDKFNDTKEDTSKRQVIFITCLSTLACILSVIGAFAADLTWFTILVWLALFFGAAVVPVAMIWSLASIPPHLKSLSSATSQLLYNLLGWLSAPLVSGAFMDCMAKKGHEAPYPLIYGFRMILLSSIIGVICFSLLNFLPTRNIGRPQSDMHKLSTRMTSDAALLL